MGLQTQHPVFIPRPPVDQSVALLSVSHSPQPDNPRIAFHAMDRCALASSTHPPELQIRECVTPVTRSHT